MQRIAKDLTRRSHQPVPMRFRSLCVQISDRLLPTPGVAPFVSTIAMAAAIAAQIQCFAQGICGVDAAVASANHSCQATAINAINHLTGPPTGSNGSQRGPTWTQIFR